MCCFFPSCEVGGPAVTAPGRLCSPTLGPGPGGKSLPASSEAFIRFHGSPARRDAVGDEAKGASEPSAVAGRGCRPRLPILCLRNLFAFASLTFPRKLPVRRPPTAGRSVRVPAVVHRATGFGARPLWPYTPSPKRFSPFLPTQGTKTVDVRLLLAVR